MGRVAYDRTLIRTGYRPYGMTNPFAAAQGLAGVSMHHGVFGPWRLAGMGQNTPFTQRGGYALHGLGDAGIPNGSLVTYQGVWTSVFGTGVPGQLGDPQSIIDGVVHALNADGQLTVMQAPQGITGFFGTIFGGEGSFDVTLKLQVSNGQGFGSLNDIISIIRHYVYTVSGGIFPQNDRITQVQAPSVPTASTAPDYQAAGLLSIPGLPSTLPAAPTDFTTWLENNAVWLALAAGALFVLPKIL
jgi:hypothetical protein